MKHKLIIFVTLLLSFLFNYQIFSQDKIQKDKKVDGKLNFKVEKQIETKKIWNAYCPVMGEAVDPEVQTVEYKGKVIGFCCKSCIKKFKKDPEKYLKNLSEDGQKFIKN